ncbi:hypothetical protein FKZ61_017690 [Litorilinea aerophila]|uniref:HPr kinase/phosphorylase C-terminal domain-containing protein n=1 Tax=Litorilinea aerophila TaxID=1204385 RepID=A0A540VBQ3_9CHLR|nr:hypothetical protein [Litorilinea aerophila]MCC9077932.1 hypothetical protein [Litorilinea aerophila]OUC08470.1 hypothetical protein RY27_08780 [Litorilinea aerophila]
MFAYQICGYTFYCTFPLRELIPGDDTSPLFRVELGNNPPDLASPAQRLNEWYDPDGSVWLAFGRLADGYLLHFSDLARFTLSADARVIRCYPDSDCPPETLRHLLLNQVIPLVLAHQGQLVLHGAACAISGRAVAFVGRTGMGKSTLVTRLGLAGHPVLTDDCLLLKEAEGQFQVHFSYPGVRLWPESIDALMDGRATPMPLAHYTEKKRVLLERAGPLPATPLSRVYVLLPPGDSTAGQEVTIRPMAANEAMLEVIRHAFQLDVTDRDWLAAAFHRYARLVNRIPFFFLAYPREHTLLPVVQRAIEQHMETGSIHRFPVPTPSRRLQDRPSPP